MKNRQWLLARRPKGSVSAEDFQWTESEVPAPAEGEVLVRNLWLSVDPAQRGWIAGDTYLPAVKIGEVVRSFAVGQVVESKNPRFKPGQLVQGLFGWQDYAVTREATPLPQGVPVETAMSALGPTGMTAWFGLLEIGRPKPGETVVVSAAAGATGSAVGQIARIKGCRAIGIAGGAEKCRWLLDDYGFDGAIDYKSEDVGKRLRELCPKGVDIFFDNVGGEILDAALSNLAMRGRVVLCGAIARYNSGGGQATGPKNYLSLIVQRGRMEGFIILDFMHRAAEAIKDIAQWMKEGRFKDRVDVVQGLENAPAALLRLFKGENRGKQLVRIAEAA
ncbi:MAG TPA: NADP-dependent oxidoreductase [Myxococcales bacterium]